MSTRTSGMRRMVHRVRRPVRCFAATEDANWSTAFRALFLGSEDGTDVHCSGNGCGTAKN